ncbi:MAG: helix-turn-helix transcriptional regulator [Advenella sp.]
MAGAEVTLSYFNSVLPQLLPNTRLQQATQTPYPFNANLAAFPLTSRASVVLLQAEPAYLQLAAPAPTDVAVATEKWFLVRAGETAYFTDNENKWTLRPGDLLLIHSRSPATLCPRTRLGCTIIALQEHSVGHWKMLLQQARTRYFCADSGWARVLSVYMRELNERFMDRIAAVPSDQGVCLETVLSLAVMMFGQARQLGAGEWASDKRRQARYKLYTDITVWLYLNFGEAGLTGQKVAREFRISVRTLHKLFREFNDSASFATFLNDIRMQNARNMLRDSSLVHMTVGDIGWQCGFSDPAHFGKVFKKCHSITPRQMRDIAHGNGQSRVSC